MNEHERLSNISKWYVSDQLDFDKRLIEFRYRALEPYLRGSHALELGPADGVMTRLLHTRFERLTVVDGARELLDRIPEYGNVRKVHGIFEEYNPDEQFDAVVMEHILEHVEHPEALLGRVKNWVRTSGRIFVGVPNAWSFHRLAGVKMGLLANPCELNSRDHALGHRRVYTPPSLRETLENAGLIVEKMGGVFLKPLSNDQIQQTWSQRLIEAFYQLGHDFPDNAAEIFAVCLCPPSS